MGGITSKQLKITPKLDTFESSHTICLDDLNSLPEPIQLSEPTTRLIETKSDLEPRPIQVDIGVQVTDEELEDLKSQFQQLLLQNTKLEIENQDLKSKFTIMKPPLPNRPIPMQCISLESDTKIQSLESKLRQTEAKLNTVQKNWKAKLDRIRNRWKDEKVELSLRVFDLETENERLKRVSVNGLGSGLHSGLGSGLNAISGIAMGSSGVTSSMERLTNLYIPVQEQISELKNQLELKNRLILELSSMNK